LPLAQQRLPAWYCFSASAAAQTVVKIGLISTYSGFVAQAADQAQKGIDFYIKLHEKEPPPDVKIDLIRRDDTPNPEVGKRLAQELIARDHVQLLTGVIRRRAAQSFALPARSAGLPIALCPRAR
jgi:branched-chain amino acid transport system substrate-binding protein